MEQLKDIVSRLTWVDYLTAVGVVRGFYVGYKSGVFPEFLRVITYLAAAVITLRFYEDAAQYLTLNTILNATTSETIAIFGLAIVSFVLLKLLSMALLRMIKVGEGGFFYKLLGLMLGGVRWLVMLSLLFMAIEHSPLTPLKKDIRERSVSGVYTADLAPMLFDFLSSLSPQLVVSRPAAEKP